MAAVVLLVDDEAPILRVLARRFEAEGWRVVTASNGVDGLAAARAERPDAIVTDFQMPGGSGVELLRALAADPALRDIPTLMLTARGHRIENLEGVRGLLVGLIEKPFSAKQVVDAMRLAVLAKRSDTDDASERFIATAEGAEVAGPRTQGAEAARDAA